jgi:hypothetical protein
MKAKLLLLVKFLNTSQLKYSLNQQEQLNLQELQLNKQLLNKKKLPRLVLKEKLKYKSILQFMEIKKKN